MRPTGFSTATARQHRLAVTVVASINRNLLRVVQQLVPTRGRCTFGPPKSRRSERTVALDAATVEALRRHRDLQLLERDLAGPAYDDHDLVFCDELGRPIYAAEAVAAALVDDSLTDAAEPVAGILD